MFIECFDIGAPSYKDKRMIYDGCLAKNFGCDGVLINYDDSRNELCATKKTIICTVEQIANYSFVGDDVQDEYATKEEIRKLVSLGISSGIPNDLFVNYRSLAVNMLTGPGWSTYDFYINKYDRLESYYIVKIEDDTDAINFKLII